MGNVAAVGSVGFRSRHEKGGQVRITFHGVRGSCPCPSEANARYGGNTASVLVEADGQDPILLDLGTGLRLLAASQPLDGSFRATALITHIHWDHVQGLPFFPPIDRAGARLDVYGPAQDEGPLGEVFGDFMRPPYFPVHFSQLRGEIHFHDLTDGEFTVGDAKVTARAVPHVGPTVGYRIELEGKVVTYISDHQAPADLTTIDPRVLELAADADVLIHDSQYTREEFRQRSDWGHCTIDYALHVARSAGVKKLVMFHHDPSHTDDEMDALVAQATCLGSLAGIEVVGSFEGLQLELT